ncbi:MAG: hypothetical protein WBQ11_18620, partial [Isosphaeraceae bacterium]
HPGRSDSTAPHDRKWMEGVQGSEPRRTSRERESRSCYRDAAGTGSQAGTGTFSTSVQQEQVNE